MSRTSMVVLVFLVAMLATAAPVHADEGADDDPIPCVKVWTDPPGAQVDPECVKKIIEDLPPAS